MSTKLLSVQAKFLTTRQELSACLLEREAEIDIALTALLCGEHVLFIGPPGTAKTMLSEAIAGWLDTERYIVLLSKGTEIDELFGPVSFSGLKAEVYRRTTNNTLVTCGVAFLDEIFKASSAILNPMLKVLNERRFRNGNTEINCPLELAIGASNEWPVEAKELAALFDRFLFRKSVEPVAQEENINKLMFSHDLTPRLTTMLSMDELAKSREECRKMNMATNAAEAIHEIRRECEKEGIFTGDRRRRKTIPALQAYAWIQGESEVTMDSLEVLKDIWWVEPTEQPKVLNQIISKIAKPSRLMVAQYLGEATQLEKACDSRDLENSAVTCKKLADIASKLSKMTGDAAVAGHAVVSSKIKAIRAASIEATW
jgi:MoxR-like ATPase